MPISWNPNDYNDPVIKKLISQLNQLVIDYSSHVEKVIGKSCLMIKDRKNLKTLMEYQPNNNKMIDRDEHRKLAGVPEVLNTEFSSAINKSRGTINDSNIPIFIELLRKVFDSLFHNSKPDDSPLSHSEGLSTLPQEGPYLPTRDDFDNARRKSLRDGKKEMSIDDILDIIKDNVVEAGLSLAKDWRSVTKKNILLWSRQNKR